MLNITRDRTCKCNQIACRAKYALILAFVAGSLVIFDPAASAPYVYSPGDIAWVLASTTLVWIMVPGVGFFYSGLLR